MQVIQGLNTFLIIAFSFLMVPELIRTIKSTSRIVRAFKNLQELVMVSGNMLLTGIAESLKEDDVLAVRTPNKWSCLIKKNQQNIIIAGIELNFQKDVIHQLVPMVSSLKAAIYAEARYIIFARHFVVKCNKLEEKITNLQHQIELRNTEGEIE